MQTPENFTRESIMFESENLINEIHLLAKEIQINIENLVPNPENYIKIGSKKLSDLTAKNLKEIAIIAGAIPSLEFWNHPVILEFSNTTFSDTITLIYKSYRKSDGKESMEICFFFNWEKLRWNYTKDYEILGIKAPKHNREANFEIIKYLIAEGYDVPIY